MKIKLSVVCPVLNEVDFIGFSIMSALPLVHEFIYALDAESSDGTRDLLFHLKQKYAHEKLVILDKYPNFHPLDTAKYNKSFNDCIAKMTGDAAWFYHPDMLVTKYPEEGLQPGPFAWYTHMTSYAGDFQTVITKGRCDKWKNIHVKKYGLHYSGSYGSQNEDFYHSDVTGKSYKHYGTEFTKYPFPVKDSGISTDHYCELKGYTRRLEKMKTCLKTLYPSFSDIRIQELAENHPRVTLEQSSSQFGNFEFKKLQNELPEVLTKYREEFGAFKNLKEPIHA